ncbi:hypothetical protein DRQ09_06815 [candidate division KSB1 bacterium]|nr:MAG: hypothetical protein DRQ09_06815 [candidate division KSB1 bacterium]
MNIIRRIKNSPNKWKIYLLLGVIGYFIIINQIIHIRPDHAFLALVLLSFMLGKEKAKRFLIDWSPFVIWWVLYDIMRGIVDNLRGFIHISGPYKAELFIFGRFFGNKIPAFWLQNFQNHLDGSFLKDVLDLICANFYTLHFGAPLLLAWVLWHTTSDRRMHYSFVYTFTVLNVLALITFYVYPSAPPWYVFQYGFEQPHGALYGVAGSLINVDKMLKVKFFTTLWDNMNPNHFAAIPSLHGAYPVLIVYYLYKKFKRYPLLLFIYPAGTWFAAVYLNHHYIIDLIIGVIYIVVAYLITEKLLFPYVFDKLVFKKRILNHQKLKIPEKSVI